MQAWKLESDKYNDSSYLVTYTPVFNEESYTEFHLNPNGAHLLLSESYFTFKVDLPDAVVPDNFFADMLFENVSISVNNHIVTIKISEVDYGLSSYMLNRTNMTESSLKSTGALKGYFGPENYGSFTMKADTINKDSSGAVTSVTHSKETTHRRKYAEKITHNGKTYFRYYLLTKINSGIVLSGQPLPKEVPVKIRFNRAEAKKALIGTYIEGTKVLETYGKSFIDLIDPEINACYIQSSHYDQKLNERNIPRFKFKFNDYGIHRLVY